MVAACEISIRKVGLPEEERDRIVRTLEAFELPTRLSADFPRDKILDAVRFDKKFARGEVRFVVVPTIGSARIVTDVTMEDIETAANKL
jgi:3-dehydroquinate synthetase